MTQLETKHIRTDGGTQARAGLNMEKVNEYKELLHESGGEWPFKDPIIVYYDGSEYWLADGFHRVHACWTGGRFVIEADVRQGTRRDAQLHAAGANADHGLPRTAEDKRRAVTLLLEDAEWGRWSDREIARRCKVSPTFVGGVRKELGDTVHVDSERVYTRNGEERVMDTAAIGGKPRLSTDDMRKRLRQSLRDEMYATYQVTGITDAELRQVLSRDWGLGGGSSGPEMTAVYKKGGANPGFWYNNYHNSGKPTLSGRKLIVWVREVLELPYPQETAVTTPVHSSGPAGPSFTDIKAAVAQFVDSQEEWPELAGRTFTTPLHNLRAHGEDTFDYFDRIRVELDAFAPDAIIRMAAREVWRDRHPVAVLNSEQTADPDDDYNYADELQQQIEAAETAVSQPMHKQVLQEVEHYEAEARHLFATSTDPRLTALQDVINAVTGLTVDKSLTIDVIGPLARALNFLEDAKKALTRRREYAAWLRNYEDDDGRRWQDLTDTQTWHKNSPCYQAFVKAFPGEDLARSALMDARAQLERETAVSEETP